jgi:hypothetical protein
MILREYLQVNNISLRAFKSGLEELFGSSPSVSSLQSITNKLSEPSLELALMICRCTQGAVEVDDMVLDKKRKHTQYGVCIMGVYKHPKRRQSDELVKDTEIEALLNEIKV